MYRRLRCLLLLLCLALPRAAAGAEGAVEEQLARMFEKYSTLGASVAVFQNGSVTYTYTMAGFFSKKQYAAIADKELAIKLLNERCLECSICAMLE